MRSGPYVEVQKTPGSTTWYNALVVDINGDTIRVEFEDDVWPARDLPSSAVRRCPPAHVDTNFNPRIGDAVEVWVAATETNPSGWAHGQLTKVKQKAFYFVALDGASKGQQDIISERDGIRKRSTEQSISVTGLVRKLIPVDRELHGWIRSQDSAGCLSDVQIKGKLLMAVCTHNRPDGMGSPKVFLVGDERSVNLGEKLLVEIHFKRQITMQRFHEHRDKLMEYLSQRESHYKTLHKEVFSVDSTFVGRIIGKKGENIKRIKDQYEVSVLIQDPQDDDWDALTYITVSGADPEAVKKAREEIEYVVVKVPIEPDEVGWVIGKGYQNLTEISNKAKLWYARFDDRSGSIELCGLQHQVEDAQMMITVHRDYHNMYKDLSLERHNIQKRFEELDEMDGKGGKKGGKAGGKKGAARGRGAGGRAGGGQIGAPKQSQDYESGYYQEESQPSWGRGAASSKRSATGRGGKGRGK